MADSKVTGLGELIGPPADSDMIYLADVSDTSMAASGTSKKNQAKNYLRTNGTANTLGANISANGYNFTGAGTVTANSVAAGTVTAGYPLHVVGASGVQAYINAASGQYTQMTLANAGADKLSVGWDNSGGYGYISSDSAFITMDAGRVNFNEVGGAWANATYNTGWADYSASYYSASYKKVGDLVFVRGVVKRTSGSSTTIFTLPSGYRPAKSAIFGGNSDYLHCGIDINIYGEVLVLGGSPTTWISLDGIVFSTV